MNRRVTQGKAAFISVLVLTAAAFFLSLLTGKYPIPPGDVFRLLTGGEASGLAGDVFRTLRLPRTIAALLAGFGLGMSGSVYQTVFKNPLASPDIIGVASGANLGAAAAIVLSGASAAAVTGGALAGSLLAVALVTALVRVSRLNTTATYILAGIVITSLVKALIMALKYFADEGNDLAAIEFWTMGSFGGVTPAKLTAILPLFLAGILGLVLLRRQIGLMALGDDESRMLGVRLGFVRAAVLGCSTAVVASVISVTGLITFIGLVSPHIARLILKRNNFSACLFSGLAGGALLLLADSLARTVYRSELPVSILTTVVGVPFLVYFMHQDRRRAL